MASAIISDCFLHYKSVRFLKHIQRRVFIRILLLGGAFRCSYCFRAAFLKSSENRALNGNPTPTLSGYQPIG
jgi:hypothetical protein